MSTPYSTWRLGYYEGHRQVLERFADRESYVYFFGTASRYNWASNVLRFEALGLLSYYTQGFEDGIAVGAYDCGLLEEDPFYTEPPLAEGEYYVRRFKNDNTRPEKTLPLIK